MGGLMLEGTREVFEWIEIDQDSCDKEFSVTCSATLATNANQECFDTRQTCVVPAEYGLTTKTLRFCKPMGFKPDGWDWLPFLVECSISGASINPIGANVNNRALGTRTSLSATIQDSAYSDRVTDPYIDNRIGRIPTYNPELLGTFWTKWRARNPFYLGRPIRHKSAYINRETGALEDIETMHYFMSDFSGPDQSGTVSLSGRDLFSKFQDANIQIPRATTGKLLADISEASTSFTLDPAGIGDEQYGTSGWMNIGSEIFAFTRTGDTVTRGASFNGLPKSAHHAGDTVQQCLYIEAKNVSEIMQIVCQDVAGIPVEHLDVAQWDAEQTAYMPRVYTRMIAKPEGFETCLASLSLSMYFYPIWDERTALLKIRAVRPAQDDPVHDISEFGWIDAESGDLDDKVDQLFTQCHVYFGQLDPTKGQNDVSNYAAREVFATDGGAPEKNGKSVIKEIFASWIPRGSAATALELGEKLTSRYGTIPKAFSFTVPARGFGHLWVGDFIRVDTFLNVDPFGNRLPMNMQILSAAITRAKDKYKFLAQEFVFEKPIDPNEKSVIVTGDWLNLNLYDFIEDEYGIGSIVDGDRYNVTVRQGAVVGSATIGTYAFTIDDRFPAGVEIYIDWLGIGAGRGGDGDGYDSGGFTVAGSNGGPCILVERPVTINNLGIIGGGGGGGSTSSLMADPYGHGGGAGRLAGSGGEGYPGFPHSGSDGSLLIGGTSGNLIDYGGGLGMPGSGPFASHLPGIAITGASFITWINKGDVRGPEIA